MKTYVSILIATLFLLPLMQQAQDHPLDDLMDNYKGQPGVYFLDMTTNMFLDTIEGQTGKTLHLKMISFEETSGTSLKAGDFYDSFFDRIDRDAYTGLVEIKSKDEYLEVMVKKETDGVSEFIIAAIEENETTFIGATGNFDLKDLASLKALQNCRGLQVMKQLCEE
jgi:hypothetical protein